MIKHGDVVLVTDEENKGSHNFMKRRIRTVALYVDIKKHPEFIAGYKSGIYLFRGQLRSNPLNIKSFGKCEGMANADYNKHSYIIGHISSFIHHKFK